MAAASVVLGYVTDEADAARRTQLKTLLAVVNSDGTIPRGKGVASTTSSKVATGQYEVKFNRDASRCTYSATFDHDTGFIFITLRGTSITTTDRNAMVEDSAFHLIVQC